MILAGEITERRRQGASICARARMVPLIVSVCCVALLAIFQKVVIAHRNSEILGYDPISADVNLNPIVRADSLERLVTPLKLTGKAAQLLLDRLNDSIDAEYQELVLPAEMFIRASSGQCIACERTEV